MKKTQKKVLGFLGLGLVAGMTIFAASLPSPEALATTSVTDSIVVRVMPSSPEVNITSPLNGTSFARAAQVIKFDYSQVNDVSVTMEKAMPSGTPQIYPIFSTNANLQPGSNSINIDFSEAQYGYGEYTVTITGQGASGVIDDDVSSFTYYPVTATIDDDAATNKVYATLDYDDNNTDIDHFEVNIYDKNGNVVISLSPINKGTKKIELPFEENNLPAGQYIVSVSAIDTTNSIIYKSFDRVFVYNPPANAPTNAPNTGGLFVGLNISKTDYLITGMVVFAIVGVLGTLFITRGKRRAKK